MQDIEWGVKVPYTTTVQGCMTLIGSEGAIHYYSAGMQDIEWEVKVPYTTTVQGCKTLSGE